MNAPKMAIHTQKMKDTCTNCLPAGYTVDVVLQEREDIQDKVIVLESSYCVFRSKDCRCNLLAINLLLLAIPVSIAILLRVLEIQARTGCISVNLPDLSLALLTKC